MIAGGIVVSMFLTGIWVLLISIDRTLTRIANTLEAERGAE